MLSHNTLVTFYRGCGWSEEEAIDRAIRYLKMQKKFYEAMLEREQMTEEDEYRAQIQETRRHHGD